MPADKYNKTNNLPDGVNEEPNVSEAKPDERIWELLNTYADGEATAAESAEVEALLVSDVALRNRFAFLQNTSALIKEFEEQTPPEFLTDRILDATSRRKSTMSRVVAFVADFRQRYAAPMGRYAMPVGALAAASVVALVFWPRTPVATHRGQVAMVSRIAPGSLAVPGTSFGETPVAPATTRVPPRVQLKMPAQVPTMRMSAFVPAGRPMGASGTRVRLAMRPGNVIRLIARGTHKGPASWGDSGNHGSDYQPGYYTPVQPGGAEGSKRAVPSAGSAGENIRVASASYVTTEDTSEQPATSAASSDNGVVVLSARRHSETLPPDSKNMVSNADMKRERVAETQGYDRTVLRSIASHEATVSIISGRF